MSLLPNALSTLSQSTDLRESALDFFAALGYQSPRTFDFPALSFDEFTAALPGDAAMNPTRAQGEAWQAAHLLFQFTGDELGEQKLSFEGDAQRELFEAFVFIALELKPKLQGERYTRTELANIARELNKPFASPVIVLFKHGETVTLASVARRENKVVTGEHVLQKVSLLKDIQLTDTHRAHRDILGELGEAKLGAHNWTEFLKRWNAVLDISELNKKFYRDYKTVFEFVERAAVLPDVYEDKRRDWTQRLFNRLLFLRFLEKKGWLEFEGDQNYLRALFTASQKAGENDFLNDRLFYAFFFGLGFVDAQTHFHSDEKLQDLRGKVPYLNGGLFEQIADNDAQGHASLPNEAFAAIFDLFDRYYFTVDESTPLEQEVGIDPEMLGKVFEELVTGRHESGSYYTPRGIVSFMGREALKGYLEQFDAPEAVSKLVDDGDGTAVSDPERILAALREVTICDPACGSGAYLLGMMQELLRLREALFAAKARDHQKIYDRKLEIIACNLYGVDKDPFAISIAMLRLWLSLIIEFEGETPPPLPNLKYKLESGDSLAAPLGAQLTLDSGLVNEFNALKGEYVKAHHEAKTELETKIEAARARLKVYSSAPEGAHDWRTEFAEVFESGGFDIVLANPPYIRQELIKDQKPQLKKIFGDAYSGTADLYCYFYLRGHELLKDGGQLAFISPNKWFRVAYGAKLRAHFAEKAQVRAIIDFGDLPVFQTATTYPMIFHSAKTQPRGETTFVQIQSLDEPYPDVRALVLRDGAHLPPTALDGANWKLSDAQTASRLETMRKSGLPLTEHIKGRVYRGITTGFNQAFIVNGSIREQLIKADKKSNELIKPLAGGRDVKRWDVNSQDKWIIFTRRGTRIQDYPAIENHLQRWKAELTPKSGEATVGRKPGRYKWFEIQDEVAYFAVFDKPKIISTKISLVPTFAFDDSGLYLSNTAYFFPVDDIYLLGVLNSDVFFNYAKQTFASKQNGWYEVQPVGLESFIIPTAGATDKSAIETLVAACLAKRGADCEGEEAEINAIVAKLYGLD